VAKLAYRITRRVVVIAGAAVPERFRFGMIVRVSGLLAPAREVYGRLRGRPAKKIWTSTRELVASIGLGIFDECGIDYTPKWLVIGQQLVDDARRLGRGIFVVSAHGSLNPLFVRYFHDIDHSLVVIASDPMRAPGRPDICVTVQPSRLFLLRVRSVFRAKGMVVCFIDRPNPTGPGNIPVQTPDGAFGVSTAMLRLATRLDTSIIFCSTRVRGDGTPVFTLATHSSASAGDADAIAHEFISFMRRDFHGAE
jgi:hypothetical protein